MVRPDDDVRLDAANLGLRAVRRVHLHRHEAVGCLDALGVNRRALALAGVHRGLLREERFGPRERGLAGGLLVVLRHRQHVVRQPERRVAVLVRDERELERHVAVSVEPGVVVNGNRQVRREVRALRPCDLGLRERKARLPVAVVQRRRVLIKRDLHRHGAGRPLRARNRHLDVADALLHLLGGRNKADGARIPNLVHDLAARRRDGKLGAASGLRDIEVFAGLLERVSRIVRKSLDAVACPLYELHRDGRLPFGSGRRGAHLARNEDDRTGESVGMEGESGRIRNGKVRCIVARARDLDVILARAREHVPQRNAVREPADRVRDRRLPARGIERHEGQRDLRVGLAHGVDLQHGVAAEVLQLVDIPEVAVRNLPGNPSAVRREALEVSRREVVLKHSAVVMRAAVPRNRQQLVEALDGAVPVKVGHRAHAREARQARLDDSFLVEDHEDRNAGAERRTVRHTMKTTLGEVSRYELPIAFKIVRRNFIRNAFAREIPKSAPNHRVRKRGFCARRRILPRARQRRGNRLARKKRRTRDVVDVVRGERGHVDCDKRNLICSRPGGEPIISGSILHVREVALGVGAVRAPERTLDGDERKGVAVGVRNLGLRDVEVHRPFAELENRDVAIRRCRLALANPKRIARTLARTRNVGDGVRRLLVAIGVDSDEKRLVAVLREIHLRHVDRHGLLVLALLPLDDDRLGNLLVGTDYLHGVVRRDGRGGFAAHHVERNLASALFCLEAVAVRVAVLKRAAHIGRQRLRIIEIGLETRLVRDVVDAVLAGLVVRTHVDSLLAVDLVAENGEVDFLLSVLVPEEADFRVVRKVFRPLAPLPVASVARIARRRARRRIRRLLTSAALVEDDARIVLGARRLIRSAQGRRVERGRKAEDEPALLNPLAEHVGHDRVLEDLAVRATLAAPDADHRDARLLGKFDAGVDVGVPDAQLDFRTDWRAVGREEFEKLRVGRRLDSRIGDRQQRRGCGEGG